MDKIDKRNFLNYLNTFLNIEAPVNQVISLIKRSKSFFLKTCFSVFAFTIIYALVKKVMHLADERKLKKKKLLKSIIVKINNETLLELIVKSIFKNNINNNFETKYLPDDNINDSLTFINSGGGDYLKDSKSKITSQSQLSANVCFYLEENSQEYEIQLELSDIKTSNDVYNFIQYILSEINCTPDTTDIDSMCSDSPCDKKLDLIPYYCGFKEEPGFDDNFNIELSTFINQNNSRMAGPSFSPFVKPYIVDVMDTIKEENEADLLKLGQINKIDIENDSIDNNKSKNIPSFSDELHSFTDFYDIIPSPQISDTKLKQNTAASSSSSSSPVSMLSYNLINDVYINSWKRIYNFFSLKTE